MPDVAEAPAPLSPEREREISNWIDQMLRMHPEENPKYSPRMNPPAVIIQYLRQDIDPHIDVSVDEIIAWRTSVNELVGDAFA